VTPTPIDGPEPEPGIASHQPAGSADVPGRDDRRPPGSVAEEAALLLDLLARRDGSAPRPSADSAAGAGASEGSDHVHGHDGATPAGGSRGECTCGGSVPAACRVCPVCQLIAFVQQVDPATIEKVADVVGFAATALRDLATAQRERRAEREPGDEPQESAPGGTP
jgi:hypothetical protein